MNVIDKCQTVAGKNKAKGIKDGLEQFEVPQGETWCITVEEPADKDGPIVRIVREGQDKKVEYELGIAFPEKNIPEILEWVKMVKETPLET